MRIDLKTRLEGRELQMEAENPLVAEVAAQWVIWLSAEDCDSAKITAFEKWLIEDSAHMDSFDEACRLWNLLEFSSLVDMNY